MPSSIATTHFSDPHCPWAYSASPALSVLHWRFGDQLDWRHVMIGLAEGPERYVAAGYTPTRSAQSFRTFERRFGMPFGGQPRERVTGTGLACRVVVAARLAQPEAELAVFRALQFAQFTTTLLLDREDDLRAALAPVAGQVDVDAVVGALDDPAVEAAYQQDRAEARTAAGRPIEAQGREADTDGAVRYTAPSIIFATEDGRSLEVGGFQPLESYDTALANLDVSLERRPAAGDVVDVLRALPYAPVTREVAACMTTNLGELDHDAAEQALIAAAGEGLVRREAIGSGALWHLTR
ncbi:MAG TPA: DsbA family protein [Baekduia sp.]|uniref:DsbA family protein n=1 Tax=Baekduia sp. TaxID=2600305 RepID=UPI002D1A37E3|nr:DsbA family protein [Baekduia sp.]HMJ36903.1 DsbA family protein [Baekduia sp.]